MDADIYRRALLVERETNARRPHSDRRSARLGAIDAELARIGYTREVHGEPEAAVPEPLEAAVRQAPRRIRKEN